jgi:hypothetical protein
MGYRLFAAGGEAVLTELLGGDEVRGFVEILADVADGVRVSRFGAGADGQEGQVRGEQIQAGVRGVFFIVIRRS